MSLRKTFLMVLFLFASGIWFFAEKDRERSAPGELEASLFGDVTKENLIGIDILTERESFGLQKTTGTWGFKKEAGGPLRREALETLIDNVLHARIEASLAGQEEKLFGFESSELTVRVYIASGEQRSVVFGSQHRLTERRYVKSVESGKLFLVDNLIFEDFFKTQEDMYDYAPFSSVPSIVSNFNLKLQGGDSFQFFYEGERWSVGEGEKKEVSSEAIEELFDLVSGLQILSYHGVVRAPGKEEGLLKIELGSKLGLHQLVLFSPLAGNGDEKTAPLEGFLSLPGKLPFGKVFRVVVSNSFWQDMQIKLAELAKTT